MCGQLRPQRVTPPTADCCTVAGFEAVKPATAQHSAVSSEPVSSRICVDYYPCGIGVVKVSVRLPSDDVEFFDAYASEAGLPSRSAALHKAVSLLRALELSEDYQEAWDAWAGSGEGDLWEPTGADGLTG